ncbi:hypothetical protein B0H13DRAFT_1899731 [Mycena leptocephala]|nr:hypothetical protein B0H13DRAFT_1899731 [Mycena leptocephala]
MSDRQLLLQNLLLQSEMDIDDYMDQDRLKEDDEDMLDQRTTINTDSDSSSMSSTSSDSSDSSTSSSESDSSSESNGHMEEDDDISDDEDELYAARLAGYGEMLQVVSSMRLLWLEGDEEYPGRNLALHSEVPPKTLQPPKAGTKKLLFWVNIDPRDRFTHISIRTKESNSCRKELLFWECGLQYV